MSKIARFAVLVAASLSLAAALSSTASAATWTNTGNTAYTASVGTGTLSATGLTIVCNSGTMTATVATGPFVGGVWTAETGTANFVACSLAGTTITIDCAFSVTATNWTNLATDVTHATVDTTCGAYVNGNKVCHVGGTIKSISTNPTNPVPGTVTSETGTGLDLTGSGCPMGNNDVAHLSVMRATITNGTGGSGSLGPIITRTP